MRASRDRRGLVSSPAVKRLLVPAVAVAVSVLVAGAYGRGPLDEAMDEVRREVGGTVSVEAFDGVLVVASDAVPEERQAAMEVLERTYRALRRDFGMAAPGRPIAVYLWSDTERYSTYVEDAFGTAPSTRFGVFRPAERKMVVNLESGRGTISHELVHAMMADDFPDAPAWLGEGLASLFDRPEFTASGSIRGRFSWRLPELQVAIRNRYSPGLDDLLSMDHDAFYGRGSSLHYAAATHLCFHLQEKGLLRRLYRDCREGVAGDPSGREALEAAVGMDLERYEAEWGSWASSRIYPVAEVPWPAF